MASPMANGSNGQGAPDGTGDADAAHQAFSRMKLLSPATQAVHADDHLSQTADVAPPLHVSTTFRYADDPAELEVLRPSAGTDGFGDKHIYSRWTAPNTTRLEAVLSSVLGARTLTYSSGLAAYHAALVYLNPKRVAIGDGYHGCHGVLKIHQRLTGSKQLPLDCPAEELSAGDLIHLETPLNPTGVAFSIAEYAEKAHSRGAYLLVDATFGPPGLQDPFAWGADIVMHSGTKYLGGHSDMLCGVLATKREDWYWGMWEDRGHLGSVMGSFEGWLGVRSLRTLELRVQRQSQNAEALVSWLQALLHPERLGPSHRQRIGAREGTAWAGSEPYSEKNGCAVRKVVQEVTHASLQADEQEQQLQHQGGGTGKKTGWIQKQMPNGYGPVFAIVLKNETVARTLPSRLALFHHATSLGGVESLIEWRKMSDPNTDPRLLRLSIGIERYEDLRDDLIRAFKSLENDEIKV
ncbi:MAG: hypothetical protein M4579_002024 [Chaenotheca gracillima]|nr:MAG: hypothetical protein M4579_002024 [Chaenotheca gracillima]